MLYVVDQDRRRSAHGVLRRDAKGAKFAAEQAKACRLRARHGRPKGACSCNRPELSPNLNHGQSENALPAVAFRPV